jgi:hypothetical protein
MKLRITSDFGEELRWMQIGKEEQRDEIVAGPYRVVKAAGKEGRSKRIGRLQEAQTPWVRGLCNVTR